MTNTSLVIAVIIQWVLLIGLCALVLLLFRQVGMLHERLGPAGALTLPGGLSAGDTMPPMAMVAIDSSPVMVGGAQPDGKAILLFFLSPTCPVCKSLLPALRALAREHEANSRFVLASDGDEDLQRRMVADEGLQSMPLVLSTELGRKLGVSRLPYAALVGADGVLIAKGLVNSREHLDSLFEARVLNSPSLQDYLGRKVGAGR